MPKLVRNTLRTTLTPRWHIIREPRFSRAAHIFMAYVEYALLHNGCPDIVATGNATFKTMPKTPSRTLRTAYSAHLVRIGTEGSH
jgi:hypothetical protein